MYFAPPNHNFGFKELNYKSQINMAHKFGIEDLRFAFPSLYMDLADLAKARNIEPAKLQKGLGLLEMSVCDVNDDVITMSADALLDIVQANEIKANELGRIYVGTESSIDGSKPIASYLLGILTQYYVSQGFPENCLRHVDVVDMTFACIGAVDAMHNSLAWLYTEPEMKAIVIAADIANYDLASSGEYTQGAGASAILLSKNPSIMEIEPKIGVAAACAHDFFKPLRLFTKNEFVQQDAQSEEQDNIIAIHKETPIFDGPLSNKTYQDRITEAFQHFNQKSNSSEDIDQYDAYIFHLPYAFHGRRIFDQLFLADLSRKEKLEAFYQSLNTSQPDKTSMNSDEYKQAKRAFNKAIVKSEAYTKLVNNKIERSERLSSKVGNVYTASIFLALISQLHYANEDNLSMDKMLFFAYGSGSKSKVFSGTLGANWKVKVSTWNIEKQLATRERIDFDTYVKIRLHQLDEAVSARKNNVNMDHSGILETNRYSRNYVLNNSK